ncbi:cathelicidin-2-like [Chlamydotis macqueenii]
MRPRRATPPSLPLLLLLALAGATTPGPDGSTRSRAGSVPPSAPAPRAVAYGDAVAAAVELLNARAVSPYVLRLRDAHPRPGWPGDLRRRQELSFTVEETACRTPTAAAAACAPRWLGELSWCRGFAFLERQQPTVELSCERVPLTVRRGPKRHPAASRPPRGLARCPPTPSLRSSPPQFGGGGRKPTLADVFARIKGHLRSFFRCGRIWIRDKLELKAPKS